MTPPRYILEAWARPGVLVHESEVPTLGELIREIEATRARYADASVSVYNADGADVDDDGLTPEEWEELEHYL